MSQDQKKIVINLEELYDLFGSPNATACDLLRSIVTPYIEDADRTVSNIMILLSPDIGYEVISLHHSEDPLIDRVRKILEEEEEIDKAIEEARENLGAEYIIELNDGYEKCIAFA